MQLPASLMIVAGHPLYIEGFRSLLARESPHLHCVAARTAAQALDLLDAETGCSMVICDYLLQGPANGLAFLQKVGAQRSSVAGVLMSDGADPALAQQARRAGLAGYLSKSSEPTVWLQALDVVLSGGCWFAEHGALDPFLNERQVAVLHLASVGLCNRQIASRLNLTERTVKYHFSEAFRRLATATRTEAVARASALGLIPLLSMRA